MDALWLEIQGLKCSGRAMQCTWRPVNDSMMVPEKGSARVPSRVVTSVVTSPLSIGHNGTADGQNPALL